MLEQIAQVTQTTDMVVGLTEEEVLKRREQGQGNNVSIDTSRTYGQILRQNFFTFINSVLFAIGILMVFLGLTGDAVVSVGVVMMNVVVGVAQEFRAKAKLDRIALLTRPKVTVIREGQERILDPSEIVLGDVILARPGDQIVVDGIIVGEGRMEVDESLLTGESDLIVKQEGMNVYSGSYCVTGSAAYEATKVGAESFVNKLTAKAKEFRVELTPLQRNINFVVRILLLLATMIGVLFGVSFVIREVSTVQSVQSAAVIAGLVPAGLILMTTTAYAMGALRMTGGGALIQQTNAVESMSNVDVLCLDKTGTLTANRIELNTIVPLDGSTEEQFRAVLGDYAHSTSAGNRTSEALAEGCGGQARKVLDEVPFSSTRKWSALSIDDPEQAGVFVLGAPEMLLPYLSDGDYGQDQMDEWADVGLRVLVMLHHPTPILLYLNDQPILPNDMTMMGLISFSDVLRDEAKETIEGFAKAGIGLKIISGDNPHTVAALAKQAGLPLDLQVVSGPELDRMDAVQVAQAVQDATVFGRITPEQKEMLVNAFRQQGHYVAMIGDGVNDVLSLKKAQIGISMQSGSAATRGVADIVLLNDSFAALPKAFIEGQRILNGMEDIIRLFLTRAFYAGLIIVGAAVITEAHLFPFVPKHASLITLLTVGLPTFALAAWARPGAPGEGLINSVMHFVFPAAMTIAFTGLAVYTYYLNVQYFPAAPGVEELQAISNSRTALTTVIILMGLLLLVFVEPPTRGWVAGDDYSGDWRPTIMAVLMLIVYVAVIAYEPMRIFWEIELLSAVDYFFLGIVSVIWAAIMRFSWRSYLFQRFLGIEFHTISETEVA